MYILYVNGQKGPSYIVTRVGIVNLNFACFLFVRRQTGSMN
jgi:hypothetical protein